MSGMNITRDEATKRSQSVTVTSYNISLDLSGQDATFSSTTEVTFKATVGSSTWIDFVAPSITSILLNGVDFPLSAHDGFRVALNELQSENSLVVTGECAYMNTGEGLHRFIDPEDCETYLYSQFEIADARRVFACFDQPDQKAVYTFTVTAPDHWKVISNGHTPTPTKLGNGTAQWAFPTTDLMSTYITAIVAGPYHEVRDEYVGTYGTYPLGLFCRQALAQYLDPEELFTVTKQGFAYFENAFDTAYPFHKYDQLFVPEFNAGAMENAGAVTHHESYVFRSKVTRAAYEQRANTVLHELAHMWFGDLVTMKWWDDLWLNESFAEWAAHHASAVATQYTEAWTNFVNQRKAWGYRQDQLPTTHPIVADMVDLDAVEVNFDGITYAKGASVLRQLVAWVGEDQFLAGLRQYFKKYAWGNTQLSDLLTELEVASGRDLKDWSVRWLETAGVNTIRPEIHAADGHYTSVAVIQEPPVAPAGVDQTLRPHRIRIGLYQADGTHVTRYDSVEVDIDGPRTEIPELVGKQVADLLLLNDDDLTFVKIRLDDHSLQTAVHRLNDIEDSLARALIWGAAWDMTRDAELSATEYLTMVNNADLNAVEIAVAQQILGQARTAIEYYAVPTTRGQHRDRLFNHLLELIEQSEAGSDYQLAFVKNAISVARTPEHTDLLKQWFDGSATPAGLVLDADLRWAFVAQLVALGALKESAIDEEIARDNTANGQRQEASARAEVPTVEAKVKAWHDTIERDDLANAIIEHIIGGFSHPDQRELLEAYVDKYFEVLPSVWANRTNEIAQAITFGYFPSLLASQEILDKTDAFLATPQDPGCIRLVRESRDNVARALMCQARDAKNVN